jgi:hypothetical protein
MGRFHVIDATVFHSVYHAGPKVWKSPLHATDADLGVKVKVGKCVTVGDLARRASTEGPLAATKSRMVC